MRGDGSFCKKQTAIVVVVVGGGARSFLTRSDARGSADTHPLVGALRAGAGTALHGAMAIEAALEAVGLTAGQIASSLALS